ncbi:unnamed protein product [Boreogadus saida]
MTCLGGTVATFVRCQCYTDFESCTLENREPIPNSPKNRSHGDGAQRSGQISNLGGAFNSPPRIVPWWAEREEEEEEERVEEERVEEEEQERVVEEVEEEQEEEERVEEEEEEERVVVEVERVEEERV